MDASQHQFASTGIQSMPREILTSIFRSFRHPGAENHAINLEGIRQQRFSYFEGYHDIKNLRLVCRLFNQVASPFLMPTIRLQLDQASLDRVTNLLNNPLIAAGLHGIQISMVYRFSYLASDMSEFITCILDDMRQEYSRVESSVPGDPFSADPEIVSSSHRAFFLASQRCLGEAVQEHEQALYAYDRRLVKRYEKAISAAYEHYKAKYHEMHRIASQGLLVRAITKLIAYPGYPVYLDFVRRTEGTTTLWDIPRLERELKEPQNLSHLHRLDRGRIQGDVSLLHRIIWDLPIAIHRAGGVTEGFAMETVVMDNDNVVLFANDLSPGQDTVNQLRQACQSLREFHLDGIVTLDDPESPPTGGSGTEGPSLANFIGAFLSGCHLRTVWVSGPPRGSTQYRRGHEGVRRTLGNLLGHLDGTHLQSISIWDTDMSQQEIEQCFGSMGSEVKIIRLFHVALTEGTWGLVLDALRTVLKGGNGSLYMGNLSGGNYGRLIDKLVKTTPGLFGPHRHPELMELFKKYALSGNQAMENPGHSDPFERLR